MSGISPKLPFNRDDEDGYALNKTYMEAIKQNLKNLVLTNPGERIMDQIFGVGLGKFLFEQNDQNVYSEIAAAIREQVEKYMPMVSIDDIKILSSDHVWTEAGDYEPVQSETSNVGDNEISVEILLSVDALGSTSVLSIGI
jgi:phage baseplate assembly protein W